MKALELTPTSWILSDNNEQRYGLLVKKATEYVVLTTSESRSYASEEELIKALGKIKYRKRKVQESESIFIKEYPVDEDEIYDIDEETISFKKTPTSKTRYAAGYWAMRFSTHYVGAFCPKISTLETYQHIGPFKDKFTLNNEIYVFNKRINDEEK